MHETLGTGLALSRDSTKVSYLLSTTDKMRVVFTDLELLRRDGTSSVKRRASE